MTCTVFWSSQVLVKAQGPHQEVVRAHVLVSHDCTEAADHKGAHVCACKATLAEGRTGDLE